MKTKTIILSILCLIAFTSCSDDNTPEIPEEPGPTDPTNTEKAYYISPSGSDDNTGLTPNAPYKTFEKVLSKIQPGDVVNLMDGTYTSTNGPVLELKAEHSGTAEAYITFQAMEGHKPVISAYGKVWNAVRINASYFIMDGIELVGNNQNLTYEDALQTYENYKNGIRDWDYIAGFNTNGIDIGGTDSGKEPALPHHIIIRNCIVHDFPGGGIGASQADYLTFENNIVYNNAWYTMYACSGISILVPYNSDENEGYKLFVRNNFCHTNKTLIPWNSQDALSDGNGIIIDVNSRSADGKESEIPYRGRTLVQNNISVNNGGSGIHSFKANHVDIINNTAYHNGTVVGYADIHSNQCEDVYIMNNIMYSRPEGACNEKPGNNTEYYDYNIYYGGEVKYKGENDIIADPQFVNLSLDRLQADFRLKSGSPGIDSGTTSRAPSTDITGTARPQGSGIDRGAYEQ